MIMSPRTRKLLLTAHVTTSVGWCGALAVFLAHALVAVMSREEQIVRAMSIAMGLTAWLVIMPLSLATLVTGLTQALGTAWGLLRHYWVLFKLLLTAVATVVLLLKLGPISMLAEAAGKATFSSSDLVGLRTSLALHAAAGLVVLLAAVVLAIYKPAGLVRKGPLASGAILVLPLWVKFFGTVIAVLILLVGIMMFFGGHGPGAHAS
ncbi:MAG: hypothetical protein H0X13_09905 [Ramlibacter sp.]|nr:hypothetical protein [Ramlibacter sp.]